MLTKPVSADALVSRLNTKLNPHSTIWRGRDLRSPLGAFYRTDSLTGRDTRLTLQGLEDLGRELEVLRDYEVLGRAA